MNRRLPPAGGNRRLPPRSKTLGVPTQTLLQTLLAGLLAFASLVLICGEAHGQRPTWKRFSNRAGWSIAYPADWKVASCKSCPDPRAPNVFVDFFPPLDRDSGWVMVEHLADKPASTSVDAWFTDLKQTANLNAPVQEQRFTLQGLPALKVRYRNPSGAGIEMEEVYIVAGSKTFAVLFSGSKSGVPLEEEGNYRIYLRMLDTFRGKP